MNLEVIIPMGPGHEKVSSEAVESVRMAMHHGCEPFENVRIRVIDDTEGKAGRSMARNQGIESAESDWIFFLDADDFMAEYAFDSANWYFHQTKYDAIFGAIYEVRDGCVLPRRQISNFDNYEDILAWNPYHTLQMGHFVKTEVARKLMFNVEMDTGEDWDYYLRLWKDYKCVKIPEPLMLNRRGIHSTGQRSATGRQWMDIVHPMIMKARHDYRNSKGDSVPVHSGTP